MEVKATRQWYYFLVLFLALAFGRNICSGLPVMTKRFVRIVNLLDNKQLVYHYHSKDDDLGQRVAGPIAYGEQKRLDSPYITSRLIYCICHKSELALVATHLELSTEREDIWGQCIRSPLLGAADVSHINDDENGSRLQMQEANEGKSNEAVVLFCALPFFGIRPKKLLWLLAWEKALCVGEFIAYGERKRVESTYFTSRLESGRKCMTGEQEHEDEEDDDDDGKIFFTQ
ncbi:PREDICTED: PRUPE_1G059700 [Prunus dulcis]|uniref:PREDICTED: PRUPE_1G059700 n=1 Tax=Prunus dulcis TaxID=3755 RepID=A0A5E4G5P8_PRUDU|nr:PREDICTED: PRUPE_1G059700 [Prunus dulcis]